MKKVLVFIPVFNDVESLFLLTDEIIKLNKKNKTDNLIIHFCFLMDGSPNETYDAALSIVKKFPTTFSMVCYSRNYGYERSLTHSINFARSDALVFLDCDGEDPPEMIFSFIEKWKEGQKIVYGYRFDRPENIVIKTLRHSFYDLLKTVSDGNSIPRMANFFLIDSSIYKYLKNLNDNFPFLRFKIANLGFSPYGIKYTRRKRIAGKSAYNITGNLKYALAGILSSSTWVLRVLGIAGFVLAILMPLFIFTQYNLFYFSTIVDFFIIISLSFILIYLSRIYSNSIRLDKPIVDIDKSIINSDIIDISFYEN